MPFKGKLVGILCLPVTPFNNKDEVNEPILHRIVDIIIENGDNALVPGITSFGASDRENLVHS
jgi:dihydrodipicolinate synthase/N-acetylneuraminate lyase